MSPIAMLVIVLTGIAPVVHWKTGEKHPSPLAGLALVLLAIEIISW